MMITNCFVYLYALKIKIETTIKCFQIYNVKLESFQKKEIR